MRKLGILFDIDKLDSVVYGSVAWKIFWRTIGPDSLPDGVRLYEGDTAATLHGTEQVYCLVIEAEDVAVLDAIRAKLATSDEYLTVAAGRCFLDTGALEYEPLPLQGHFEKGQIVGRHAANPRAALAELRRMYSPRDDVAPLPNLPHRLRPATSRSANLPEVTDLQALIAVLGQHFPGQASSMRFSLTPEELCDLVERYADVFDVYWSVAAATVAETGTWVYLMPRGRHDTSLEFFGLMEFPSQKDATSYCERESITQQEWGLQGFFVHNFVGLKKVDNVSEKLYRCHMSAWSIRAKELWPRICARRHELKIGASAGVGDKPWWRFWG